MIRISPVRVIDQEQNQLGIIPTAEALSLAREAGLDLVEVAPGARPPVCRIMDFGKWKYRQKKHHKKHHEQQLKEVRIRPKTDDNDRKIKVNRAIRFLKKGDKVQFTMVFRGRERAHREIGVEILMEIAKGMGDMIKLERPPSMDGRNMVMIVSPNKNYVENPGTPAPKAGKPEADKAAEPAAVTKPKPSSEPTTVEEPTAPVEPSAVMEKIPSVDSKASADAAAEAESKPDAEPGDSPA